MALLTLLVDALLARLDHLKVAPPAQLRPRPAPRGHAEQLEGGPLVEGPDEALEPLVGLLERKDGQVVGRNEDSERDDCVDGAAPFKVDSATIVALVLLFELLQL